MNRLLLYVHFNRNNGFSKHVLYQLEKMRPLFSQLVFISNSPFPQADRNKLEAAGLIDQFIQRENAGYDFAAWRDGMAAVGFDNLKTFDSVTVMNDTCFGPLWDMAPYYDKYEQNNQVDFWGMTNHRAINAGHVYIDEHVQSYFMSFKQKLVSSDVFQTFWKTVETFTDVQKVIDNYETKFTKRLIDAGFKYETVLNTLPVADQYVHSNFTIHYPQVLMDTKVPFIKIKTFDLSQHLSPYTLKAVKEQSDYPLELITTHMSDMSQPTPPYLIDQKLVSKEMIKGVQITTKKVAVHLHAYYLDLVEEFLDAFASFRFSYDLFLTTDSQEKKDEIQAILEKRSQNGAVYVTGKKGRDVGPMFKLKEELETYDYIGHFHTKKSPEYPYWVGDSWRKELQQMLIEPANELLSEFDRRKELGLVIADIPTFFRYTQIVQPWNENRFAPDMNKLWERMNLDRQIDFTTLDTFIMSYGTFVWFKYDALKPLFDLEINDDEIPAEPLPQHTVLHSIERILVYLAWAQGYDYAISKNDVYITPFVDNTVLNLRPELMPNTYVDFDHIGGIKGALKYIYRGPGSAIKYIVRRLRDKWIG